MYNNYRNRFNFSYHNGHPAWSYQAKTVWEAAIEDLLWRKLQTDPHLVEQVILTLFPGANVDRQMLYITPDLCISLANESCGAYSRRGGDSLYSLYGNNRDFDYIKQSLQYSQWSGYYLEPLLAKNMEWLPENVVNNLLSRIDLRLQNSDRFYFHKKACHRQTFISEFDQNSCMNALNHSFPALKKFAASQFYWYRTETGKINYGIIYFYDAEHNEYKLPISAWLNSSYPSSHPVYDTLNIAPPYPLYNLPGFHHSTSPKYVFICESERVVEEIKENHKWLANWMPVTTYTSIHHTDWNKIRGRLPIIFPAASAEGCNEAFRLNKALEKEGLTPKFLTRQKDANIGTGKFIRDLNKVAERQGECSLAEFAEYCRQVYGIMPPPGTLPKAIPLFSLHEAPASEALLSGLLNVGDQMMIYGKRGTGKSLFALLLAICFGLGKSALNGKICPSRKYQTLLLDSEMSGDQIVKRARYLCTGHSLPFEGTEKLRMRSPILENTNLNLETDKDWKDVVADMEHAEIIIVDSVFKFFPSAMNSDIANCEKLLGFLDWCRKNKKTLILIDHEGKGSNTPFGSMAKDIALDVVLRLIQDGSNHHIKALVTKIRHQAQPSEAYLDMKIESHSSSDGLEFKIIDSQKSSRSTTKISEQDNREVVSQTPTEATAFSLDEDIIQCIQKQPNLSQGEITHIIGENRPESRSTIQAHIKNLRDTGKLPFWENPPKISNKTSVTAPKSETA